MNIHKYILRTANAFIDCIVILSLVIVGAYAAYALWDNNQIYSAAANVQQDMKKLKPNADKLDSSSFEELLKVNPDICGWITLDDTFIDFPIVQGESNLEYINKDIYGEFSLAGSIFLDTRCDKRLTDQYSLVYGHHMSERGMFSDLSKYKEKVFFDEHRTGTLILPDRVYKLKVFASLLVKSTDRVIFEPEVSNSDISKVINYAEQEAKQSNQKLLSEIDSIENTQILALSTCSYEFSDARTIVLAVMEPYTQAN